VKKVYLPENAAYYRAKLLACMAEKDQCKKDVLDCVEKCDELELYVPSSTAESTFAIQPSP